MRRPATAKAHARALATALPRTAEPACAHRRTQPCAPAFLRALARALPPVIAWPTRSNIGPPGIAAVGGGRCVTGSRSAREKRAHPVPAYLSYPNYRSRCGPAQRIPHQIPREDMRSIPTLRHGLEKGDALATLGHRNGVVGSCMTPWEGICLIVRPERLRHDAGGDGSSPACSLGPAASLFLLQVQDILA